MSTTFDCPQSSYCGGRNCLSVARNLVGVRPRGENCFDEAAPSEFISGVNRFRTFRDPVGTSVLLQVTSRQFSLMYQRRGCGRHYLQSQWNLPYASSTRVTIRMLLRVSCSRVSRYVQIIGIISRVGPRLRFPADRYSKYSEVSARPTCDFSQQHCAFELAQDVISHQQSRNISRDEDN